LPHRTRIYHRSRWLLRLVTVLLLVLVPVSALAGPPATPPGQSVAPVPVRILRDEWGVPHIYADDLGALFFGYGYTVAQDRLFQLEMMRRSVWGTVAEVLGPAYLNFDRDTRQLGYTRADLEARMAALAPDYRTMLTGYAQGVNAYITEALNAPAAKLPAEFNEVGFQPELWSAADVAQIFVGTMAARYSDLTMELRNAAWHQELTRTFGEEQGQVIFNDLLWMEDPNAVTTIAPTDTWSGAAGRTTGAVPAGVQAVAVQDAGARDADVAALTALNLPSKGGSNAWLVGGSRSTDGSAILLGGPQMGWYLPGYVHEVGLHGAGFDMVGSTTTGYLPILFGHNGQTAWTSTAGVGDVVDVFVEKLDPQDPTRYLYNGQWQTMTARTETIKVKGAADVQATFYRTVHGPVMAVDSANRVAYARARSWEGLELESMAGWIDQTRATTWAEFQAAGERMALTISIYYADRAGNIGYLYTGRYPVRHPAQDPRLPTPGTGEREWQGFVPARKNPRVLNPAAGYIANWNQQPARGWANPDHYTPWGSADRALELSSYLEALPRIGRDDAAALIKHASFVDVNQRYFRPQLLDAIAQVNPDDARLQQAAKYLAQWNGLREDPDANGFYDQPGQVIFEAWLTEMLATTFPKERLGSASAAMQYTYPNGIAMGSSLNVPWGAKVLKHVLDGDASGLPLGQDYLAGKAPTVAMVEALNKALTKLEQAQGTDMQAWRAPITLQVFAPVNFLGVPQARKEGLTGLFYNRGSENHLIQLSPAGVNAQNVVPPGQSGFVTVSGQTSAHYKDQMALYHAFAFKPMYFTPAEVAQAAVSREVVLYHQP
jgi:penicillin amidase